MMKTKLDKQLFDISLKVYKQLLASDIVPITPNNENKTIKIPEHWLKKEIDDRIVSNEIINWRKIKKGDVVVHGNVLNDKINYITLTYVDGKYWEYFEDGYYKSTSPEYCHWLVKGQKHCNGKLIKIEND